MRICLYTSTSLPKIGGQELVVDALARKFSDRGHKVVVLEGGAASRPVIATRLPGLSEVIPPNRTGPIVPAGSAAELARVLDQLIGDRASARNYGWSKIAGQHLKLFKKLIRRRGAKGGP